MPLNTLFFRYRASILRARGDDTPAVPAVPGTPGIPGEPPHPGLAAGEGATWLLGSMSVNSDRPPVNFLSRGHFSWNFGRWDDAGRWASTGNSFTSANSMTAGISHAAISTLDQRGVDRQAILQSIDTLKVTFLQAHGKTGFVVNIEFQISNREVLEATDAGFDDFMLFTVSADGFTTGEDPEVHPFTDFDMRVDGDYVWGQAYQFSPWPSRIAILGTGGLDARPNRIEETGTYTTTTQSISDAVVGAGEYAIDDRRLTYHWDTQTAGNRTAFLEAGDRIRLPDTVDIDLDTTVSVQAHIGLTLVWGGDVRITANRTGEIELIVSAVQAIEPPPGEGSAHMWEDIVVFTFEWARFETPDPSPEVPPFGGTPDIPAIPGIPEIPKIDGDPPVYKLDRLDTLYAEYVQHQQYETDGAYERTETWRIRKGAVELFDWLSMTDVMDPFTTDPNPFPTAELIEVRDVQPETRTFDLVTGRRALVPLTYDGFGGHFEDPGMRRYNPRGAAIFVPSDEAAPAPAPAPVQALVRFGWAQTQVASEGVLLRAGNHPVDGALLTSPNTPVHTPPFPPALVTDRSLYLHIWISGNANPTGIILGGDNQILGFGRIGELSVDGVAGILYVSNQRLSSGISAFFIEVTDA